jgi:hypothetical protein
LSQGHFAAFAATRPDLLAVTVAAGV